MELPLIKKQNPRHIEYIYTINSDETPVGTDTVKAWEGVRFD